MHRLRVYGDTSVFGGVGDDEYEEVSRLFFAQLKTRDCVLVLSGMTTAELRDARPEIQEVLEAFPSDRTERIAVDDEVKGLADEYLAAGAVGGSARADAIHVAAASVAAADLIVSWNFKHIVNFRRIRLFNSVNVRLGYRAMTILSPQEVIDDETEEEV
jgi:hypothetical protein